MRSTRAALAVLLALACAVEEPPSGGPEDKAPPAVVETTPSADSTGVDPASPIAITFGEKMTRARIERLVTVQPPIEIERVRWEGNTLVIEPRGGLQRDTTYVVRLKPGYRDSHGVTNTAGREFAFATGDAPLDTARISGTVLFKREPSGKAMVRVFRVPREADFRADAARPDREVATRRDGTYTLGHLPANDARFIVMAYIDQNGNAAFDKASEPFTVLPDTLVLTGAVTEVAGVQIGVIDPNEPGLVRGTVANQTGIDSLLATVSLTATRDSTRVQYLVRCDTSGAFEFARVKPGGYRLWAFLDLRADSARGHFDCGDTLTCPEPWATLPDSLSVGPGATVDVGTLVLRRRDN
ncbi:MAG TPA: Ig-like domain-containing domain [Candidatus Krumholzibacteria bacterium]|nr:Ig-like domain-containing domain [Candidatus Krumholzibacteria bacterium]